MTDIEGDLAESYALDITRLPPGSLARMLGYLYELYPQAYWELVRVYTGKSIIPAGNHVQAERYNWEEQE